MRGWMSIRDRIRRIVRAAGEMLYGMTTYEWVRDLQRSRGEIERLFMLVTFGDLCSVLDGIRIPKGRTL